MKSKGCGVHPNWKLWDQNLSKNEKWKKVNFCQDQEGYKGGDRRDLICNAFFVFVKQILRWHIYFFHFRIYIDFVIPKEEFRKSNVCRGIKLILEMQICKIWLIRVLFFFFFRVLDMWLTQRTCCWHVTEQILQKYGWPSDSIPGILGHVPIPWKCPGLIQDISN